MTQEKLSYETLRKIGYQGYLLQNGPEKVLQFGEGNFLRAFADYFLDCANEKKGWNGKAAVISPRGNRISDIINDQDGLYTLYLKGKENGAPAMEKRMISVISRCINPYEDFESVLELARGRQLELIISNTTEAGIVFDERDSVDADPPRSFPAQLARVLYSRFRAGLAGLIILSCELIDHNGEELKRCVLAYARIWGLESEFLQWLDRDNIFCSTLVDRIVPGKPRDAEEAAWYDEENGYADALIDISERYGSWIIEGGESLAERLPFTNIGLPVEVVPDITLYKQRKVRILNGGHTGMVSGAFLAGKDTVKDCMDNETIKAFLHRMLTCEVIPTIPMDQAELNAFALKVEERFENPYIDHELLSISLNGTAKWRTRNLPSLLKYREKYHELPCCLTMSLAALIAFYTSDVQRLEKEGLICRRKGGDAYLVRDEEWILRFYEEHCCDMPGDLVRAVLANRSMWGVDLTAIEGLCETATKNLRYIRELGAEKAFARCVKAEEQM